MREALKKWAKAYELARLNPALLTRDSPLATSICVRRMNHLSEAEAELKAFENSPETPQIVRDFFQADQAAHKGCGKCWLSSGPALHPECRKSIDHWFATREAMAQEGLKEET